MKKNLIKIVKHYGIKEQLKYFQSEIFELNEAVIRYQEQQRNPVDIVLNVLEPIVAVANNRQPVSKIAGIKDEIADVMVMLKQIQYYYGIRDDEVIEIMKSKIKRQIKRINDEKEGAKENDKKL